MSYRKTPTPNNIGEGLKAPQRKFWKEALFVKYEKNKHVSLVSPPIPIKYLPEGGKVLCSLIAPSIKECDCSDGWKFVLHHSENVSSRIKGIYYDQSYSPVARVDSFIINISIAAIHRLPSRILDVSNSFQDTNVPIHKIVCVIPLPYYLDCFKISYPKVPLNRYDGPFCLQCMNGI